MPLTPQTQAIGFANEVNALAVLLNQYLGRLGALTTQPNPTNTIWKALGTAPLLADGSLGTPDVTPVLTNPINPATAPGLNRACSQAQYAALVTLLNAINTTLASAPNTATLAPFIGG